jgi:Iap family predicted aminopeptidase
MASINKVVANDIQISGTLDMRNHRITNLVTDLNVYPVDDDQAATKKYVDTLRDQVVSGLADLVDNGTF